MEQIHKQPAHHRRREVDYEAEAETDRQVKRAHEIGRLAAERIAQTGGDGELEEAEDGNPTD